MSRMIMICSGSGGGVQKQASHLPSPSARSTLSTSILCLAPAASPAVGLGEEVADPWDGFHVGLCGEKGLEWEGAGCSAGAVASKVGSIRNLKHESYVICRLTLPMDQGSRFIDSCLMLSNRANPLGGTTGLRLLMLNSQPLAKHSGLPDCLN